MLRELRQMSIFAHVLCKNECRTQSSQDPLDHKSTSTHVIPLDGFTLHLCTYPYGTLLWHKCDKINPNKRWYFWPIFSIMNPFQNIILFFTDLLVKLGLDITLSFWAIKYGSFCFCNIAWCGKFEHFVQHQAHNGLMRILK